MSKQHEINASALTRVAKGKHVVGEQREKLTEQLRILYAEGHTLRQLAERTGRSYQTIRNMLTEAGVALRPRGGSTSADCANPAEQVRARVYAAAIGAELVRLRRARGWTRGQTVRKLGISSQTLATYETGRTTPTARLAELCSALGAEPDQVIAAADRNLLRPTGGHGKLPLALTLHLLPL